MTEITKGQTAKIKRGKVTKQIYIIGTLEAIGATWIEYSFITHTDYGSIVIGRKRHYDKIDRIIA